MGPSGSGKSTLMHILAGLDKPTSGTVTIAGTEITTLGDNDLTQAAPRAHRVRVPVLQPTADADGPRERAAAADDRRGKPESGWFGDLTKQIGIDDRLSGHASPSQLSGGQQQRVAISRALMARMD